MAAEINFTVTGTESLARTLASLKGQLPYAQMVALNRTAEDALTAVRRQVSSAFTVRVPQFILPPQLLPREWKATKEKRTARVGLGEGGSKKLGERRRAILEPFEEGKPKGFSAAGPVAIPTSLLRPSRSQLVDPKLYPKNLVGKFSTKGESMGLHRKARIATRTNTAKGTVKGQQVGRYFVLDAGAGRGWGLYERIGPREIRPLWMFRAQVKRPPRLQFDRTASEAFASRWKANFDGAIDLALRTAK